MSRSYQINFVLAALAFIWLAYESMILYRQVARNRRDMETVKKNVLWVFYRCLMGVLFDRLMERHSKTTLQNCLAIEGLEKQRLRARVMKYFEKNPMGPSGRNNAITHMPVLLKEIFERFQNFQLFSIFSYYCSENIDDETAANGMKKVNSEFSFSSCKTCNV